MVARHGGQAALVEVWQRRRDPAVLRSRRRDACWPGRTRRRARAPRRRHRRCRASWPGPPPTRPARGASSWRAATGTSASSSTRRRCGCTCSTSSPPYPAKLVDQVSGCSPTAEDLPGVVLVPEVVELADLAAAAPSRPAHYLLPCRGGGMQVAGADGVLPRRGAAAARLDPARLRPVAGHPRLLLPRRGAGVRQVDICPRALAARDEPCPTARRVLTKCCLLEDTSRSTGARWWCRGARRSAELRQGLARAVLAGARPRDRAVEIGPPASPTRPCTPTCGARRESRAVFDERGAAAGLARRAGRAGPRAGRRGARSGGAAAETIAAHAQAGPARPRRVAAEHPRDRALDARADPRRCAAVLPPEVRAAHLRRRDGAGPHRHLDRAGACARVGGLVWRDLRRAGATAPRPGGAAPRHADGRPDPRAARRRR